MNWQLHAWRPLFWGSMGLALALAGGCTTTSECAGPAGLCLEVPDPDAAGGDEPEAGNASAAGGKSASGGRTASGGTDPAEPSGSGGMAPIASGGTAPETGGSSPNPSGGALSFAGRAAGGSGPSGGAPGGVGGTGAPVGAAGTGFVTAGASGHPPGPGCTLPPLPLAIEVPTFLPVSWVEEPCEKLEPCLGPAPGSLPVLSCPVNADPDVANSEHCVGFEWTLNPHATANVEWRPNGCKDPVGSAVTFSVRGAAGGEVVSFLALDQQLDVVLTQEWQRFQLDAPVPWSSDYMPPVFRVSISAGDQAINPRIFLDDLRWIPLGHCEPPEQHPATCDAGEAGAGAGGAPSCELDGDGAAGAAVADAELVLLDDFEDGDDRSLPVVIGHGRWHAYNDQSEFSFQYPEPCPNPTSVLDGPTPQSAFSLLTTGCGFDQWGAGMQLVLADALDDCTMPLDAAGFDGVQFWARGSARRIIFQIDTEDTAPETCEENGWPVGCTAFESEVFLTDTWTLHRVAFEDLWRAAVPNAFTPESALVSSLNWTFRPEARDQSYTFAIDDVALYRTPGN